MKIALVIKPWKIVDIGILTTFFCKKKFNKLKNVTKISENSDFRLISGSTVWKKFSLENGFAQSRETPIFKQIWLKIVQKNILKNYG